MGERGRARQKEGERPSATTLPSARQIMIGRERARERERQGERGRDREREGEGVGETGRESEKE